jgi:hypothetical protein
VQTNVRIVKKKGAKVVASQSGKVSHPSTSIKVASFRMLTDGPTLSAANTHFVAGPLMSPSTQVSAANLNLI